MKIQNNMDYETVNQINDYIAQTVGWKSKLIGPYWALSDTKRPDYMHEIESVIDAVCTMDKKFQAAFNEHLISYTKECKTYIHRLEAKDWCRVFIQVQVDRDEKK